MLFFTRGKSHYPRPGFSRPIILGLTIIVFLALIILFWLWKAIFSPNIKLKEGNHAYLYVKSTDNFEGLMTTLKKNGYLKNITTFEWLAMRQGLDKKVKPGRYRLEDGMNNFQLVRMLLNGKQDPVRLVFNNIRTKEQLAARISAQIEADSVSIVQLLNDRHFLQRFEVTPETVFELFIPNTYEFWWNTDARQFIERMYRESLKFWNENRISKGEKIGLSKTEIFTLASLIEQETQKDDEKPKTAGVYLNRLKTGMPLQADPTLKFAAGDWSIRRITSRHKSIDSPYNTYRYQGLPPGPICIPSIASIDAVLNYEKHNYLYFCARDDFSGYHVFSSTYEQHKLNAAKYHRALNRKQIY